MSDYLTNAEQKIRSGTQSLMQGVEGVAQSAENNVNAWIDQSVNRYSQQIGNQVRAETKKFIPWVVALYVGVGLAVLFSALAFAKLSRMTKCA